MTNAPTYQQNKDYSVKKLYGTSIIYTLTTLSIMTPYTVAVRTIKLLIMTLSIMMHRKMCMQTY